MTVCMKMLWIACRPILTSSRSPLTESETFSCCDFWPTLSSNLMLPGYDASIKKIKQASLWVQPAVWGPVLELKVLAVESVGPFMAAQLQPLHGGRCIRMFRVSSGIGPLFVSLPVFSSGASGGAAVIYSAAQRWGSAMTAGWMSGCWRFILGCRRNKRRVYLLAADSWAERWRSVRLAAVWIKIWKFGGNLLLPTVFLHVVPSDRLFLFTQEETNDFKIYFLFMILIYSLCAK